VSSLTPIFAIARHPKNLLQLPFMLTPEFDMHPIARDRKEFPHKLIDVMHYYGYGTVQKIWAYSKKNNLQITEF